MRKDSFVPVLQKSLNAQNPRRRDEPRNCTKYLRELCWSKRGPKALESLAGGLGWGVWGPEMVDQAPKQQLQGRRRARPWSVLAKYPTQWREEQGPIHPVPTPALQLSLKHVVARFGFGASQAAAGTHYLAGACTTRPGSPTRKRLCCQRLLHLSPHQQPGLSFVVFPSTFDPGSFLPFSAT